MDFHLLLSIFCISSLLLVLIFVFFNFKNTNLVKDKDMEIKLLHQQLGELGEKKLELSKLIDDQAKEITSLVDKLEEATIKHKTILSQKKSSETNLGKISENLVPLLSECPYDPRYMHFFGMPIDYIVFDYDQGEIVFLEVKSGKSKPSAHQKLIRDIIKEGKVYYEEFRVSTKGIKIKREKNND